MKTHLKATALALLVFAALAAAADVTGTWTGSLATGNGDFALVYNFKQDGATLSGTLETPQGDTVDIQDGKVNGDKISFTFEVQYNGGMKFTNEGSVKGDEMTLTTTHEGGGEYSGTTTLKRKAQ